MAETGPSARPRARNKRVSPSRRRRRKNLYIDQRKIDRVKALLGSSTETETIDRALDLAEDWAVFGREVGEGLAALVGRGGFTDRFRSARKRS